MITSIVSAVGAFVAALIAFIGFIVARNDSAAIRAKIEGEMQTRLLNLSDDMKEMKAGMVQMGLSKDESHRKFEGDMTSLRERVAVLEYCIKEKASKAHG